VVWRREVPPFLQQERDLGHNFLPDGIFPLGKGFFVDVANDNAEKIDDVKLAAFTKGGATLKTDPERFSLTPKGEKRVLVDVRSLSLEGNTTVHLRIENSGEERLAALIDEGKVVTQRINVKCPSCVVIYPSPGEEDR